MPSVVETSRMGWRVMQVAEEGSLEVTIVQTTQRPQNTIDTIMTR